MSGYTQIEIDAINETIDYADGKIWWKTNYNYTSKIWENLKRKGFKMEQIKTSFVKIFDEKGNVIINVNNGWVNALKELSIIMR